MHWWGNASTGQVKRAAQSPGSGWAQFPGSTDSYTLAQIQAYVKAHTETAPVDNSVLGQIARGTTNTAQAAAKHLPNPLSGWTIGGISGRNLLIRGIKIVLGGILLISGIIRMTGVDREAIGLVGKAAVLA